MGRKGWRAALLVALAATIGLLYSQSSITVGEGAPTSQILGYFLQAFARGSFSTSVALPPRTKVHRDGPGYVQDFNDIDGARGYNFALAKPDSLEAVFQMCCEILALHSSIGSFTGMVGYPLGDPLQGIASTVDNAVADLQNFEGGHAIVAYKAGVYAGRAFFIRDPYVSRWRFVPALGFPIGQERNTTSRFGTTGTQQDFQGGMILATTSGTRNGQIYTVSGPIYAKYFEIGTGNSFLGYPIGDEILFSGRQRQNFEGGLIEYVPGSGQPAEARAPVTSVVIDVAPLSLQVGNVVRHTVQIFDSIGNAVTDRPVTWTTSNRSVIQIEAAGLTATLRAVGPGFANVTAFVDGIASGILRITVTSVCCQPGEGAPNATVQRAVQDAISRNNITPRLPTDNPVRRLGAGYVQEFSALTPAALGRFLVTKSDAAGQAFVVGGERLARYLQLGGVTGALGFAISDATGARQLFENLYALAGSPPILVGSPITTRWGALGFESGPAGLPIAEAAAIEASSFGTAGVSQAFANGAILGHVSGSRSGQAYLVAGLILARYTRLNGAAGSLGLPVSEAFSSGGRTQQNFEGGSIDYAPGDSEAQERLAARVPAVTAVPNVVTIGARVRISLTGFAPARALRVSITSQPDFEVSPAAGAVWWDQQIRPGVLPGSYRVVVRDLAGNEAAETSYRVRPAEEARLQLIKVSGDNQSALPASEAALPLVVRLTDDVGSPIAGSRVRFAAVAPAVALPAEVVTDAEGYAQSRLRLPPLNGLVLANAEAGGRVVTFAARAEEGRLTNFPTFQQAIDDLNVGTSGFSIHKKGSLLTALAALFRFYQDRGELPSQGGFADPATLNQFLGADGYLMFTFNGRPEPVVNLPRALAFVSDAGDFEAVSPDLAVIRDSLNLRRPVLLGLMLRSQNQNRGAHYVVATGVGPDGTILIYDPSPDWNRTTLSEYLSGFTALGRNWNATLLHALRLRLGPRSSRGFLIHGPGSVPLDLHSPYGVQGYLLRIPAVAAFDEEVVDNGETAQLWWLDGTAAQYQLNAGAAGVTVRGAAVFDSLARGVYRINPDPASFSVTPQVLALAADGVRNAAGFGTRLSPGSLVSIFGAGLSDGVTAAGLPLPETLAGLRVAVGGLAGRVLFASPFQANLQLPLALRPGVQPLEVSSAFGTTRFDVAIEETGPGIFLLGSSRGAVLNEDGLLNTPLNAARQGSVLQVFATGLGEVAPSPETGAPAPSLPLAHTVATVTATLDGRAATVLFAGLAPGFAGLYQVNVVVPPLLPPNPAARLTLRAAGVESNLALVAVQ